jgi:RNA polymerase sigma-70 factor (ECF subfamily)
LDRELLWKALEQLPKKTRELFSLHFVKGMTHEEIGKETGLPLGTVKTRLRRGLIDARKLLKDFTTKEVSEA